MFPKHHENVQIPLIPLIGLGSWMFGRKTGLMLILPVLGYSYFLTSIIYPDMNVYYEAKGGGIIIMAITATLIGNIRTNYYNLKRVNKDLDHRIEKRKAELGKLTIKLINDAETTRIAHGQILHDEIGQQLTGIQLYCSSLAEQLDSEKSPSASIAVSMEATAKLAHDIIRKTARMLFPIRIHETGLIPAVTELVWCINDIKHIDLTLQIDGAFRDISAELSLALYRICHESIMCAASALNAGTIRLGLDETVNSFKINLQHNGTPWIQLDDNTEQRLILYRLEIAEGMVYSNQTVSGFENVIFEIPKG